MSSDTLATPETDLPSEVSALEALLRSTPLNSEAARRQLRRILYIAAKLPPSTDGSTADAIALASDRVPSQTGLAGVVLRCFVVPGMMPDPSQSNQLARSTVALVESAFPELLTYLKVSPKEQNHVKFASLQSTHVRVCDLLDPVRTPHRTLEAIVGSKKDILGCLNHAIVRQYCALYRLKDIKTTLEYILSKVSKIYGASTTLLFDIQDCRTAIVDFAREFHVNDSFLVADFLQPFFQSVLSALDEFISSQRGRFQATITTSGTTELQKRYPLHEVERVLQIAIPLRNQGPGLAVDMRVSAVSDTDSLFISNQIVYVGNVVSGDFTAVIEAMVLDQTLRAGIVLQCDWGEIGSPERRSDMFEFVIIAQQSGIDWDRLAYRTPYSISVAEGSSFVGREDKVRRLAAKLLRIPPDPFYLTGQKRVGKTSLALASARTAEEQSGDAIAVEYILWGAVAHAEPAVSMKQLGIRLDQFIRHFLPPNTLISPFEYMGSLTGIISLSQVALELRPSVRFVFIIDEFDEVPKELYLHGNLAETFFGNLRAIGRLKNVCIVMVGGENMPFVMDRQGQKLNNYGRVNLSYYSRSEEWSDFSMLVRQPTEGVLSWSEDAVGEVFNISNGNPYFAKLVCDGVWKQALEERDAYVTAAEVRRAIQTEVSDLGANHFAHLWQDGVPRSPEEREPDVLRRLRTLVALARCLRARRPTTLQNVVDSRISMAIGEQEIAAVLNDFVRRQVLSMNDGAQAYEFVLPLFKEWLADVGLAQLVGDQMTEELSNAALAEENRAVVRSEEVARLARDWPAYRGRPVGSDEIREWYQQTPSLRDQRLLFSLLTRLKIYSEAQVRDKLKTLHRSLITLLPDFTMKRRTDRRNDILVTYVDGAAKSGAAHAPMYADENSINGKCVIERLSFATEFQRHQDEFGRPAAVVIVDDLVATGKSLSDNVTSLITGNSDLFRGVRVFVVAVAATKDGQDHALKQLKKLGVDIDFKAADIVAPLQYAFPRDAVVWQSTEDEARAKALVVDLGARIYKQSPMGYGGLGLLIAFPTNVPNNTLPIIHSEARGGFPWRPLLPRSVH